MKINPSSSKISDRIILATDAALAEKLAAEKHKETVNKNTTCSDRWIA